MALPDLEVGWGSFVCLIPLVHRAQDLGLIEASDQPGFQNDGMLPAGHGRAVPSTRLDLP